MENTKANPIKYKWKVSSQPTAWGKRAWPEAIASDGTLIAYMVCSTEYSPRVARSGEHDRITIRIRSIKTVNDGSTCKWMWKRFVMTYETIGDAKAAFASFIDSHPNHDFMLESVIYGDGSENLAE